MAWCDNVMWPKWHSLNGCASWGKHDEIDRINAPLLISIHGYMGRDYEQPNTTQNVVKAAWAAS